jgi:hypothetical protein
MRLVSRAPVLQGLAARLIGTGLRPEHVDWPERVGSRR